MQNDHRTGHSDQLNTNACLPDDSGGTITSDQYLSYFKDDEAKAWERKLFAPDMGIDEVGRKTEKETLDLLWKTGINTAVPMTTSFEGKQEQDDRNSPPKDNSGAWGTSSSSAPKSYSGNHRRNPGKNRSYSDGSRPGNSSVRKSSSAWEVLNDSGSAKNIAGPSGGRKSSSIPAAVMSFIFIGLIAMTALVFIKHILSDINAGEQSEPEVFVGRDDREKSGGNDILTGFGFDYCDFYTSKYIASYEQPGDEPKYQELCMINPEPFLGTSSKSASIEKLFFSDVNPTWLTLAYVNTDTFMDCGYTIMYADPQEPIFYSIPYLMYPPQVADEAEFFEEVILDFTDPDPYLSDNYNDCQIGKIQTAYIDGHKIKYLEVTYTDEAGREYFDVYSIEQKPMDAAFITECRCEKGEVTDGKEALSNLYGMLNFQTENFGLIDASRFLFTQARVYNDRNNYYAAIDVSGLGDLKNSELYYKDHCYFQIGEYGYNSDPVLQLEINYLSYNSVKYYGGFEKWIENALKSENDRGDYPEPVRETGRSQFTYNGYTVYFLSLEGAEKIHKSAEDVALFMYRIETPDADVAIDLRFEHDIPENWDPEEFLKDHVTVEPGA